MAQKTPQPQDIFTLVTNAQEKAKILSDLMSYGTDIKIKILDPGSNVFSVKPTTRSGTTVICQVKKIPPIPKKDEQVVVQFNLSAQKYISQVPFELDRNTMTLNFSGPLYQVQRRADFRLRLPGSYKARLRMVHKGKSWVCTVIDLSAGGCRIEAPSDRKFESDQIFEAVLSTAKREDLDVQVSVRHVDKTPDKDGKLYIGMQFVNQSAIVKNRMAALVMDLYREFFTKRP